jgi:hypothetical protein
MKKTFLYYHILKAVCWLLNPSGASSAKKNIECKNRRMITAKGLGGPKNVRG